MKVEMKKIVRMSSVDYNTALEFEVEGGAVERMLVFTVPKWVRVGSYLGFTVNREPVFEPSDSEREAPRKFDFGTALVALRAGKKVAREGWNGKGMFLFLVPGSEFNVSRPPLLGNYPEGTPIKYHAHVDMKTATGDIVPWLCSQTDMLALDWMVVA